MILQNKNSIFLIFWSITTFFVAIVANMQHQVSFVNNVVFMIGVLYSIFCGLLMFMKAMDIKEFVSNASYLMAIGLVLRITHWSWGYFSLTQYFS
jgi:hypothetical protein